MTTENNQQAAREWLPIDSAPKNGDWFVAWASAGGHYVLVCWGGEKFCDDQGWGWSFLSHWSPLPAPFPPLDEYSRPTPPDSGERNT